MTEQIIIAGSGGQGIMLLGKVLAEAVMREGKYVTWFPSYGAEVRGGTAYCMVIISDNEIGSPYVKEADTIIIMNQPSLEKFRLSVKKRGLLIINSSLADTVSRKDVEVLQYPFTDIALDLGNIKVANMVILGCYLAKKKIINIKSVLGVFDQISPADKRYLIEINKQAVSVGGELLTNRYCNIKESKGRDNYD